MVILILIVIACSCTVTRHAAPQGSPEAWFIHQSPSYYSSLAHACDKVLRVRPVAGGAMYFVSLPDSTLPKPITDLHPGELVLTSTTISIGYHQGNDGFWVGWGADEKNTNLWTLEANLKGGRKIFYAETRKPGS